MSVKQKSTGYYLTLRGGFCKPMTASARVASFNTEVSDLVSTTPQYLAAVCRTFKINPETVELTSDPVF